MATSSIDHRPASDEPAGHAGATGSGWAEHTPGPWHVSAAADPIERSIGFVYGGFVGGDADYGTIAITQSNSYADDLRHDMACANARLIAAAPEMLAALKVARECIDYCRRAHKDAQSGTGFPVEVILDAVIAKAEGRP